MIIRDLIRKLQEHATIVVSSHNLVEIQELCSHVAILDHGKLVLASPVDAITRSGGEYNLVFTLLAESDLSVMTNLFG